VKIGILTTSFFGGSPKTTKHLINRKIHTQTENWCGMRYIWTREKIDKLRRLYPRGTKEEIMKAFTGRTWIAIKLQANRHGIYRETQSRKQKEFPRLSELWKHILSWSIAWEGSIMLHYQEKTKRGVSSLHPAISIGNTNFKLLKRLKKESGYGRCERTNWHRGTNNKPVRKWEVRSIPEAYALLSQIIEYLPAKREQGKLLLEFLESRLNRWRMPYTEKEYKIQKQISKLNKRGKNQ